jgi:hypothetical protein
MLAAVLAATLVMLMAKESYCRQTGIETEKEG